MLEPGLHLETAAAVRRPLIGLALMGALGAALGLGLACPPWPYAAGCLALALAAGLIRHEWVGSLAAHLATCALFALAGALQQPAARPLSLLRILPAVPIHAEAIGVVGGEAARSVDARGQPQWRFRLEVEAVRARGSWQAAHDEVQVAWSQAAAGFEPALGDRWHVRGLLQAPGPASRSRLLILRAERSDAQRLAGAVAHPVRRACERGRAWCAGVLGRGLEDFPREAGMLRALVLGYRQELPPELFQAFSRTGTLHVVAVSGSHVAIFAGILVALLKAGGLSRTRWIVVLAPALLLYCMSTGLAPSAIRACIMALMFWSATLFDRRPDGGSALGLSALLILLAAPDQILDAGFVLSFAAVGGLMIFYPPLRDAFGRPARPAPGELPASRGRVAGQAAGRAAWHLLAASLAAWLVTTPLTMAYFNLFSPSGLLLNLVAIPLAGVVLFAGTLSLFAAPFSGLLVEVVNHAARVAVSTLMFLVERADRWPGSHFYVASPPAWLLAAWAAALLALFFGRARARWWVAVAVVAAGAWSVRAYRTDRAVRGVVWCRDGVLSGFMNLPGEADVLVDTGRSFRARELVQRLHTEGVDRLGVVILTRARADAAGGLPALLREIPVGEVWCAEGGARSRVFLEALAAAEQLGVRVRRMRAGDSGEWAGRLQYTVLPDPGLPGSLSLHLARGPASLRWDGAGDGSPGGPPAGLWLSADGGRSAAHNGLLLKASGDPLAAAPPGTRPMIEGDEVRWEWADERGWRYPHPAITVSPPVRLER